MGGKKYVILIVIAVFIQSCVKNKNWNQYLGPDRNATIEGPHILRTWTEPGPVELWSFALGEGYGGASNFKDEVFILDRKKGETDILRCIDLISGKEKWNYSYKAEGGVPYPGSRAVPAVDRDYVWIVGPLGHIYCIDKKSHFPVWNHNLLEEFEGERPNWGVSQSPLIYKDLVIVAPQGKKAGVVAFNKVTGEIVWQSRPLTGINFHVSPILAGFGGKDQVIVISPYDRKDSTKTAEVTSFDAESGEELWKYEGLHSFATITPATVIDEKRLFLTDCSYNGNYDPVSIMLEIVREGSDFRVKELFFTEEVGSKIHPAVLFEDHLYLNHTKNPTQMMCLNLEGKLVWEKGSAPDFELGALILVDGLIINQDGKNGDIHLIEPSPEGYREVGKASFFSSEKSQAWAPLAYSQGKLIVRNLEKMVCVDLQKLSKNTMFDKR